MLWLLDAPQTGPDLVVRTLVSVAADTELRVVVREDGSTDFTRANKDVHVLGPDRSGVLDTVASPSVDAVRVKGFESGTRVCVQSLAVGRFHTEP